MLCSSLTGLESGAQDLDQSMGTSLGLLFWIFLHADHIQILMTKDINYTYDNRAESAFLENACTIAAFVPLQVYYQDWWQRP